MTPASRKRLVIAVVAAGLVLLGTAYWAFERQQAGSGGEEETYSTFTDGDRTAYYSAADLVFNSSRVVIGTYLDSSTREVDVVSRETGQVIGTRTDVIQRFRVVETLNGVILPGEIQEVVTTSAQHVAARENIPASEETYEVLSPVEGQEYALFLHSSILDRQKGSLIWGFSGEPGMAAPGTDGTLRFLLTEEFEEELRAAGKTAPFTATLDDIREEVARWTPGVIIDWAFFKDAAEMVSDSSRIVIATYLDASTREVEVISPGTGLLTGDTATHVYQRFEVVETLKGSVEAGEIQEVGSASAQHRAARERRSPAREEPWEVLSPVKGQQYVLFLRDVRLRQDSRLLWGFSGVPGMAVPGTDGTLQFLLTRQVEKDLREGGLIPPGESALFTATLDEIRAEIARQGSPTPTSP